MKNLNYSLIISDFDGTLVRSNGEIAPETKASIDRFIAAGGRFCICTGRMLTSILPRAKELGLKGLVAAYQGSVIADIESGEVIVDGGLSPEEAAEICAAFEEDGLHIHLYSLNDFYSNKADEALSHYERVTGVKGRIIAEKASAFALKALKTGGSFKKVLALVDAADKERVYRKTSAKFGGKYYVTYSSANLVEVTSREYSKGTAVRFMAERYGVPLEKTIAVGDSLNDLPMLETAELGIAVKNADSALKEKLFAFDYTNDENAVGRIIETYGFNGEEE